MRSCTGWQPPSARKRANAGSENSSRCSPAARRSIPSEPAPRLHFIDEYAREIRELQVQVDQLVEAEEEPKTISELESQIEVLKALYESARELFARGESDGPLKSALQLRGYGSWTLENVYAFVYDAAVDQPAAGPREFVNLIHDTDFAWILSPPDIS
jgi:hypothetical protein